MTRTKFCLAVLCIPLLSVVSCGNYDREEFRLIVGKQYALKEWPDSNFVSELDSLFRSEPLKQPDTAQVAEIVIDPSHIGFKPQTTKSLSSASTNSTTNSSTPSPSVEPPHGEMFAERFMAAMQALQADPGNAKLSRRESVRDGEDLMALLARVYGNTARQMPRIMVESSLRALNPAVDLQNLATGATIVLPALGKR